MIRNTGFCLQNSFLSNCYELDNDVVLVTVGNVDRNEGEVGYRIYEKYKDKIKVRHHHLITWF